MLVFPNLSVWGNIAYKLMSRIGEATIFGLSPVSTNRTGFTTNAVTSVDDIINTTAIAVLSSEKQLITTIVIFLKTGCLKKTVPFFYLKRPTHR